MAAGSETGSSFETDFIPRFNHLSRFYVGLVEMHVLAPIAVAIVDDDDDRLLVRAPEVLESIVNRLGIALISEIRIEVTSGIQNGPVMGRHDLVIAMRREVNAVVKRDAVDHDEATVGR